MNNWKILGSLCIYETSITLAWGEVELRRL